MQFNKIPNWQFDLLSSMQKHLEIWTANLNDIWDIGGRLRLNSCKKELCNGSFPMFPQEVKSQGATTKIFFVYNF